MAESTEPRPSAVKPLTAVVVLFSVMWALELINTLWGHPFHDWTLSAREVGDLWSLATYTFVHYSFGNLLVNTIAGLGLAYLVASDGMRRWFVVTAASVLAGGIVGWFLLPQDAPIVGSTPLVLGYFSYLFVRAVRVMDLRAILAGFVVAGIYASLLWLVMPYLLELSWPAYVGGILGGLVSALMPARPASPASFSVAEVPRS